MSNFLLQSGIERQFIRKFHFSSGQTSYPNVPFMFTNLVHLPSATLLTSAKSCSLNSTNFAFPLIRPSLLLFGNTAYPLFNPHAINTCANVQPFRSATANRSLFVETFSPVPGTWSCEPRGEYATGRMECERQNLMRESWGRKGWISIWFMEGGMRARERICVMPEAVKFERPMDFVRPRS